MQDASVRLEAIHPPSARCVTSVYAQGDSEGWTTRNSDGTDGATQPVHVVFGEGGWWLEASCIPENEKEWGWHAPSKFHGDHSGLLGRCLAYRLRAAEVGETPQTDRYVSLKGGGETLYLDGTVLTPPPPGEWKVHCARLDPSGGWKRASDRAAATEADIKKVLADVTDLRIKGEYGTKSDGALGPIEFGAEDPYRAGAEK